MQRIIRGLIFALIATCAVVISPAPQAFAVDGAALLTNCANAINDPLYTRNTIATIMGYANAAALETAITNSTVHVYIASGAGEISGTASSDGNAPDLICGDANDNTVQTMDSSATTQDWFFGGGGNDSVTVHMWFSTFYGGPGNDYVAILDEASHFFGGSGADSVGSITGASTFDQGVDPDTTPPTFPSADTFSVAENSTAVGTVIASESATITIFGGEDQSKFSLTKLSDSSTALAFITAPNFEAPTDVGANNTYIVVVRGVDGSSNAGYETITVTVTDVVDTTGFNSFGLPANATIATYRTLVVITASVTVSAKVTFYWLGKRLPGCIARVATGSASTFTATCSWRPSLIGTNTIYAVATPVAGGITGATSATLRINVAKRSGNR